MKNSKNFQIVLLLLFLTLNTIAQENNKWEISGSRKYIYKNDSLKRSKLTYNKNDKLIKFVNYFYNNNNCKIRTEKYLSDSTKLSLYNYTFDKNNSKIKIQKEDFIKNKNSVISIKHNSLGRIGSKTYYTNNKLIKIKSYQYNENGDVIRLKTTNEINNTTSELKYSYKYNKKKLVIEKLTFTKQKKLNKRSVIKYDKNNNRVLHLSFYYFGRGKGTIKKRVYYYNKYNLKTGSTEYIQNISK